MERRTSIAAYDYNLGDEAKSEHIDLTKTNHYAAYEAKKLDVGDHVFVKRSNGKWGFAVLAEKSSDEDGNVYTYQIGQNHKFKFVREHQLGEYVRLVEVGNKQRVSCAQLDIDQSLSCESYTDKVVPSNQQKRPSQRRIIDTKHTGEDKENMPHTKKCDESMRSSSEDVSELSMSSPVENVMKQRRSLSAQSTATSLASRNLSTEQHQSVTSESLKENKSRSRKTSMNYSSIPSRSKKTSSQPALLNDTEEQHDSKEEEFSILCDLITSEGLLKEDQSKPKIRRSMNKQLPTNQTTVSSVSRSSVAASSYKRNNSSVSARRQSSAAESQNDHPSRMIVENVRQRAANNKGHKSYKTYVEVKSEATDAAKPQRNKFNGATWRAESDPEIIFMPSDEEKAAFKSDTSNNFNAASWRSKSDQEIEFTPSGEEDGNDQDSGHETSNENTALMSTALVLHPSSIQNSSGPSLDDSAGGSTGEKTSVNEQKRPAHEKKKRRNIFRRNFFAKKSGKKDSPEKTQRNSENGSNGKDTETANQSSSENSRPSEPSAYPSVDQSNHHTRPNPSAYDAAAAAGFVPNYPNQNVYYVSDPRLAQAYRDYAQHVMTAQATYAHYINAQMSNYQMSQIGMFSMQPTAPNVIRVGTNGISGVNYRMTSIGNGIQIGVPSMSSANVMHINL